MQSIEEIFGEDELIRLLLKRQSELNSLLEVTRAINKNISTPVLIQMLEVILQNYLQVGKLRFLIEHEGSFVCVSSYGGEIESTKVLHQACRKLNKVRAPHPLTHNDDGLLNKYDYFIPFHHKSKPLAYALIGDFNTTEEMLNNDLNFIPPLINAILFSLSHKN